MGGKCLGDDGIVTRKKRAPRPVARVLLDARHVTAKQGMQPPAAVPAD
jgi:hypothetical protein